MPTITVEYPNGFHKETTMHQLHLTYLIQGAAALAAAAVSPAVGQRRAGAHCYAIPHRTVARGGQPEPNYLLWVEQVSRGRSDVISNMPDRARRLICLHRNLRASYES
jgi:hypothetical protein